MIPHGQAADCGPNPTSQGVRGYRDLVSWEVDLINRIKLVEEDLARMWGAVERHNGADPRWLSIARTHFQEGFSALVRSIAKPADPFQRAFEDNQQDEAEQVIPSRPAGSYAALVQGAPDPGLRPGKVTESDMTAPAELDDTLAPDRQAMELERPDDTKPVKLVLAVEGIDTSDGRHIRPGALSTRPLPLTMYAQVRSTHGLDGDAATFVVGGITQAERVDGTTVIQRSTGKPFPQGSYVWIGRGWMYQDVPSPESGSKPAYTLMKDGALYGNSVDLTAVEATFEYEDEAAEQAGQPSRIVMDSGVIGSTTVVGIPAFMDAFVEVDGTTIEPSAEALVAAGPRIPSWRAAELGDECGPCLAASTEQGHPAVIHLADLVSSPEGDDIDPADLDFSTSGMVALIPANPNMLVAPGGDPADELHMTLVYLGDEVNTWDADQRFAVHRVAAVVSSKEAQLAYYAAEAAKRGEDPPDSSVGDYRSPGQTGPLELDVFAHAVFNPQGGPDGQQPATVYLFQGGDMSDVNYLQGEVLHCLRDALGTTTLPEQHPNFVPHVTAGYNLDPAQLTYTGPVQFDRIRVVLGDNTVDYPLGGDGALVASAAPLPPLEWFTDPKLDAPTALTVTDDGRVYGHLACWGTCHIGFAGQCVTPPRSTTDYAYYTVHTTQAMGTDGPVQIPVGYGTIGTGHADIRASALAAAEHYDNTGTAAFELAVGEDDHGIWVAGRLMPDLDEATRMRARGTVFSGDWRTIRGNLELVASLGVNTPGFPVPRTRIASGVPMSLVAAGVPQAPEAAHVEVTAERGANLLDPDQVSLILEYIDRQRLSDDTAAALSELANYTEPGTFEDLEADLLLATDGDHPWFSTAAAVTFEEFLAELDESGIGELAARLHLPPYIKRIANHLKKKGMATGRAIATAVNAAKKMCATGDTNWPGSQQVNAGSRAEACTAVAQWKKDRPGAK